jgi:branched-chain amino acid transport system permease protein
MVSINVLCLIILGGMGNIYGVIIGAIGLIALPDILRGFSDYRMIIFGILLIVMMIVRPQGFLPRKPPSLELQALELFKKPFQKKKKEDKK